MAETDTTTTSSVPMPTSIEEMASPAYEVQRLEIELEFVQSLANTAYINFLAQRGYFQDDRFRAYLSYLRYWLQPAYARLVTYPHALYFLELLTTTELGEEMRRAHIAEQANTHQMQHWVFYTRNRLALGNAVATRGAEAKEA